MPVVCPIRDGSPSSSEARARSRVPTELLGKTSSRLYWLAILVLVSTVVIFLSRHFLEPELRVLEQQLLFRIDLAVLALTSLTVIATHRLGFLPPARLLEVGVVFEIVVAFCLATLEFARPHTPGHMAVGVSAVAMWILVFGLFVPNTPLRTLLAAVVSACMAPLAYVSTRLMGDVEVWETSHLLLWFVPRA